MSRKHGGGYGMGAPLVQLPTGPGSDWNFAVKQPINQGFDDCLFPARPGQLFNTPNPTLAQASMAGGKRKHRRTHRRGARKQRGGHLADEDLVEGAIFYGFDAAENEIIKYEVEHVEGDEVRALKYSGVIPSSVLLEKADILNKVEFDSQLQNLRSAFPSAAILANNPFNIDNDNQSTGTLVVENNMPPMPPQLIHSGGGYDSTETSHAYPNNGWNQTLSHGASSASSWGRDTGLAQTVMAGGRRRRTHRRGTRRMRGGGCGCAGSKLFGGVRRRRGTRRMRGGAGNGYAIDPSVSIGGTGPNVDAIRTSVPCDPRAGVINSTLPLDPRAHGIGYSATPNTTTPSLQAGGAYSTGNAYPDSCYKAPGSELPVYNAQTAGFNFAPSTERGGTLPDGVTAYNDVVPYAARMGGSRRRTQRRRRSTKRSRRSQRRTRRH